MVDPRVEKMIKMITDLTTKHQDQMYSLTLDWEIVKTKSARDGIEYETILPVLLIDFK